VCVRVSALQGYDIASLNIPSVDEYICQYSGLRSLSAVDNWRFYMAFVLFRTAAIVQGVYKRFTLGLSLSHSSPLLAQSLTFVQISLKPVSTRREPDIQVHVVKFYPNLSLKPN